MKQIKTYKINQNNKPIMMDIRFNISHCSAGVAVAIDGKEEVGIDIESEILNYEEIKCNVLSDEELDTKNMNERLFRKIWTLKESYIKYNGIGMNIDLKEIDFSNFLNKDEFIKYNLHFNCYENEKYNLAICCKKTLDIRCMKYEELKRYINLLK